MILSLKFIIISSIWFVILGLMHTFAIKTIVKITAYVNK